MYSEVIISNLALNHIGHKTITSMDEASEPARRCKLLYAPLRDAVLSEHSWNFATSFEQLALLDESIPGWDYMYVQPSNCLYIRRVFNQGNESEPIPSEFLKILSPTTKVQAIVTDVQEAWAEFTYKVTDPTLFSAKFVEAFSYRLASALAQPLAGNIQLGQALLQMSTSITDAARLLNKREESLQKKNYSSFVQSR